MAVPVYADATTLIGLARIGHLDILTILPTPIRVTRVVWNEIASDPGKPGSSALRRAQGAELLVVVDEGDPDAYPELDAGESSVLSAAAAARGSVLIDERRARAAIAVHADLRDRISNISGLIGLLLLAKERNRISAIKPLLDGLVRQNFWISPAFYQAIVKHAGEHQG